MAERGDMYTCLCRQRLPFASKERHEKSKIHKYKVEKYRLQEFDKIQTKNPDTTCSMCMDDMDDTNRFKLHCKHFGCIQCLHKWMHQGKNKKFTCPTCKYVQPNCTIAFLECAYEMKYGRCPNKITIVATDMTDIVWDNY